MKKLPSLDEVLKLVKEEKALYARAHEGLVLVGYLYHDPDLYRRVPWARELRGVVWTEEGRLVSRPFHKFYNLGEPLAPSLSGPVSGALYAPKLDGVLLQAFVHGGRVWRASRHSLRAPLVEKVARGLWTETHEKAVLRGQEVLGPSTWLFEAVHPDYPVLEAQQVAGVHLLAVRRLSGEYLLPGAGLEEAWERTGGGPFPPLSRVEWRPLPYATWEEALERARGLRGLEGYVAWVPGLEEFVKLKSRWAFAMTAFLTAPVKGVLDAVAQAREDDLLALLEDRDDLKGAVEGLVAALKGAFSQAVALGEAVQGLPRREAWARVEAGLAAPLGRLLRPLAMGAYEGRPREDLWADFRRLLLQGRVLEVVEGMPEARGLLPLAERVREAG